MLTKTGLLKIIASSEDLSLLEIWLYPCELFKKHFPSRYRRNKRYQLVGFSKRMSHCVVVRGESNKRTQEYSADWFTKAESESDNSE